MKIVDRKTFMQMPKGTVFCKFPLKNEGDAGHLYVGIHPPCILMDAWQTFSGRGDFVPVCLGEDLRPKDYESDGDVFDTLFDMVANLGKEVPFEHSCGRDGLYDDDNVGFAIFSRSEVEEMITLLQQALQDGYKTTD